MMSNENKNAMRDEVVEHLKKASEILEDMDSSEHLNRLASLMVDAATYAMIPDDADYGRLLPDLVGDMLHELWVVREEIVLAEVEFKRENYREY